MAPAEHTTSPRWDRPQTSPQQYLTVVPAIESDPITAASLSAAVGTAAPTQWIGPDTLALALRYLRPFRSDPLFFDPDLLVVAADDNGRRRVEVKVRVRGQQPIVATAVNDAFEPYDFYGILTVDTPPNEPAAGSFAEMATQVKQRSGLTDERLARIFPVTREQFQRWRTGREERPSPANIRRMAALRDMLVDAATRVDSVRDWLLTPSGQLSPYDLLCQARFEEVWRLLTERRSTVASELRLAQDGAWEQVPRVAVRSSTQPDNSPPITVSDDDDE